MRSIGLAVFGLPTPGFLFLLRFRFGLVNELAHFERGKVPRANCGGEGMLQASLAIFVTQAMQFRRKRQERGEDLFLPLLEDFAFGFPHTGGKDDYIGVLCLLNNDVHILGIFFLCLL